MDTLAVLTGVYVLGSGAMWMAAEKMEEPNTVGVAALWPIIVLAAVFAILLKYTREAP